MILPSVDLFSQNFTGSPEDLEKILKSKSDFSLNYMNGNTDKTVNRYTLDAKLFPENSEIIEKDSIKKYWTPSPNSKILFHKITPLEITVKNNEAYAYGLYEGETEIANGSKVNWRGKYMNIWKRINGEWKVYLEIWNRNP